tara:strand:- start:1890 stop:2813 length:924 start_codon:yes stop_codon:yes gene_type:complete
MITIFSILSFAITFYLIKIGLPFLKNNLLDYPNERSLHNNPVPKGGGIIFSLISSFILFILNNNLGLLCLPLSIIGLIDDKYNLSKELRYISQFLSVLLIFLMSNSYPLFINDQVTIIKILIYLLVMLSGTAIINFTNFMDGIDGLVSGCMIIWFTTISLSGNQVYFVLVASLLGFITWNWCPAKIFMGDAGSTFLGLIVVAVILNLRGISIIIHSLLILSPIYLDSITCIIRRLIKKENIFAPHNKHLYQRLNRGGISKGKVSFLYLTITSLLAIAFLTSYKLLYFFTLFTIIIGIVLDQRKAYNF